MDPSLTRSGSRSKLLSTNFKNFLSKPALKHPQKALTNAEQISKHNNGATSIKQDTRAEMSTKATGDIVSSANSGFPNTSDAPGEQFEPSEDYEPDPSKSIPLSPQRQALVDDIIALYSCQPTVSRVKRYTPDCIYSDQFVYANDRYKNGRPMVPPSPNSFSASTNDSYQVIRSDDEMIQFKNKQSWTFRLVPKTATITGLVSLSLDPATKDAECMQVKYHKDQANEKDYSHEGVGVGFKKWQADHVVRYMDVGELREFEGDKGAGKEGVGKYGTGREEGGAMKRDFTKA
ncbi:fad dependent oxidoreductase [Pyrenophora seminiperda CCB06]|uniref:Fad dependent oxidoreductase n=1 Tax=Pyrenophora seminiperda CCB06 TaxID=1302712 RepID=A0A3M7MEU7_9PLEO|nr:fad dependent oxidoreductase [Pyrenophora seminiperda CCB06]